MPIPTIFPKLAPAPHIDELTGMVLPLLGRTPCEDLAARQGLILDLASRVERDRARCLRWFMDESIAELGDATARDLMNAGDDAHVIAFLLKVIRLEGRAHPVY